MTVIEMKPGFAVGDNVKINKNFYKVVKRDNIFVPITYSAITTGSAQDYTAEDKLNPPCDQIYQIAMIRPKHNVRVLLKQPGAITRWGVNKQPSSSFLGDEDSEQPIDLFVVENKQPLIRIENFAPVSVTPVIEYRGWKYQVEVIERVPAQFTELMTGGFE